MAEQNALQPAETLRPEGSYPRAPLMDVRSLKMHFPITSGLFSKVTGYVKAADDVSFQRYPGETLGLVGESGCGKTTVGRCLIRAYEPTAGQVLYQEAGGAQVDLAQLSREALQPYRTQIRMIFQDPYSSLNPRMTVFEVISAVLRANTKMAPSAMEERVARTLRQVGLRPEYMRRYPPAFSGGERQRIVIARALITGPRLILADEAVSALDVSVRAQILNLMEDLRTRYNLTYLFVSHDLSVVRYICDRVIVMYVGKSDIRSEGISYGLMLAVQLDKQAEFDRLWRWAKTTMQHPSGPHRGYFAWHVQADGTMLDQNAASDGEEWIVTALLLAAARWGNGDGILNYQVEANAILQAMRHREENPDHNARVTPMFDPAEKLVVFVPTRGANTFTDPSYQTPHYYELWARWAMQDNQFWCDAAQASRAFLQRTVHPATGLAPDYANFDGTPRELNPGDGHADFRFDAWRVAMNVAMDYLWFTPGDWHVAQSNRWLDFFYNEGIHTYGNQYTLAGEKLSNDHSLGLVAMNAVAALAADHPAKAEFVQQLWNANPPTGRYRYYDGLLYLLGLTQVSGHFRIYHLTPTTAAPCE